MAANTVVSPSLFQPNPHLRRLRQPLSPIPNPFTLEAPHRPRRHQEGRRRPQG
ncbi:hypothetical protein E2542_SST10527 [Spatholobus suberectus]|nr:hypothetical protein E2542_SST10527 [Spatholobus suberectus]